MFFKKFIGLMLAISMIAGMFPCVMSADTLPSVSGNGFYVDGSTQKYVVIPGDIQTVNGTKYYKVMSTQAIDNATYPGGSYVYLTFTEDTALGELDASRKYFDIAFKAQYGKINFADSNPAMLSVLADYVFPAETFGENLLENDWLISANKQYNGSDRYDLYSRSKVMIPTKDEYRAVIGTDISVTTNSGLIDRNFIDSGNGGCHLIPLKVQDGVLTAGTNTFWYNNTLASTGGNGGISYLTAYVSEEFFLNTRLDLANTSDAVRAILTNYTELDFASGLYEKDEYQALGIRTFNQGNGFYVEGDSKKYVVMPDDIKTDGDGTRYFKIMSTEAITNKEYPSGSYVYITFEEDADKSVTGKKYFDIAFDAQYGSINFVNSNPAKLSALTEHIFPAETFGDNLLENDWVFSSKWPWDGNSADMVEIHSVSKAMLPTANEYKTVIGADITLNDGVQLIHRGLNSYLEGNYGYIVPMVYTAENGVTNSTNMHQYTLTLEKKESGNAGISFLTAYVSEEFFKTNRIDLDTCGIGFVELIKNNFEKIDMRKAGYTEAEAVEVFGFEPATESATGVKLDKNSLTLSVAHSGIQLKADVLPLYQVANESVTWSSSAPEIAVVDANGYVTPSSQGVATITATTVDGGHTASCEVTVLENFEYYVDGTSGNDDNNDGSINSPFATIQKALDLAIAGDEVYIRGGEYRETAIVKNSGESGKPITIKAYDGEKVTIMGTEKIEGWEQDGTSGSNTIWKAYVGKVVDETGMVFYNNSYVDYAKWPNNTVDNNPVRESYHDTTHPGLQDKWLTPTWAFVESATGMPDEVTNPSERYYGTITVKDGLPFADDALIGAKILNKFGEGWYMYKNEIDDSDSTGFHIKKGTTEGGSFGKDDAPVSGNAFYIYGSKVLLDYQNEWYCDDEGYIYMITPDGGDPNDTSVEVRTRTEALNLGGNDYINVEGIDMFAGELNMEGSNHTNITDVYIEYVENGPKMTGSYNRFAESTVRHSLKGLITVQGDGNKVINNLFEYGSLTGAAAAASFGGSTNAVFAYNTVRFVGSTGVGITNKGGALFTRNDVSYYSMVARDNGGFYGGTFDGGGSEISYNWSHDGTATTTAGIYTDNGTDNVLIHHNVVWNSFWGFQHNVAGGGRLLYNNTIATVASTAADDLEYTENCYAINNQFADVLRSDGSVGKSSIDSYGLWLGSDGPYVQGEFYYDNITRKFANITRSHTEVAGMTGLDFYPSANDDVVDAGAVIENINEIYEGEAPDIGAYEYGGEMWVPGHNFEDKTLKDMTFTRVQDTRYSNKVKNSSFEVVDLADTPWVKTGIGNAVTKGRTAYVFEQNAAVHTGNYGLQLGSTDTEATDYDGVEQTITGLKPNTRYQLMAGGRIGNESYKDSTPITMTVRGATFPETVITEPSDNSLTINVSDSGITGFLNPTQKSFLLIDVKEGKNGKVYGLLSASNNGSNGAFSIADDTSQTEADGVSYKKWTFGGSTIDSKYMSKFHSDMQAYMVDTDWVIRTGSSSNNANETDGVKMIVRSKLGLPSRAQLNGKVADSGGSRILKSDLYWYNEGGYYYVNSAVYNSDGTVEEGEGNMAITASYKPEPWCMVYVSEDFFKNIELTSMGDYVKYVLRNNFDSSELPSGTAGNLQGADAEITEKTEVVFDSYTWETETLDFVTDETGTVTVSISKPAAGVGYIDDVTVVEAPDTPVKNINGVEIPSYSQEASEAFTFEYDGKSFTLLKDEVGSSMIICNDYYGAYAYDANSEQYFNPKDTDNIAYMLNNSLNLPTAMENNIVEHIWTTEAGERANNSSINYETKAKIALLSYGELAEHGERISRTAGENTSGAIGWWLRTGSQTRNEMIYATSSSSNALNTIRGEFELNVRPVFYLGDSFFTDVVLDLDTIGSGMKKFLSDNFSRSQLLNAGYSVEEVDSLGAVDTGVYTKPASSTGTGIVVNGKEYLFTNDTKEINGKTYFGIMSTEYYAGSWGGSMFGLDYQNGANKTTEGTVYANIITYNKVSSSTDTPTVLKPISEFADRFSGFGSHIAPSTTEWTLYSGTGNDGVARTLVHTGSIGIPTKAQLNYVITNNPGKIASHTDDGDKIVGAPLSYWNGYIMPFYKSDGSGFGGNVPLADAGLYGTSDHHNGTWYFVTYVSEDFFKENEISVIGTGAGALDILRSNLKYEELSGWSNYNRDVLFFGTYDGEGVGIVADKTVDAEKKEINVKVSINNNGINPIFAGSALIVAVYSQTGLEALDIVDMSDAIPATSMTEVIEANLPIDDANEAYTVKVMLWNGLTFVKPLCNSVVK